MAKRKRKIREDDNQNPLPPRKKARVEECSYVTPLKEDKKNQYAFWEYDFGKSHPEPFIRAAAAFYREQIGMYSMNLEAKKRGMWAYFVSTMQSKKDSHCVLSIIDRAIRKLHTGRGYHLISYDTANTNNNYLNIMWGHYSSSPFSPRRLFHRLMYLPQPQGDSWMPNDSIAKHCEEIWGTCSNGFLNKPERVQYLKDYYATPFQAEDMSDDVFLNWSDLKKMYLKETKWVATYRGKSIPIKIREIKMASISFQKSDVYNKELNKIVSVKHPNQIYIRVSDDYTIDPLIVSIVKPQYQDKPLPKLNLPRIEKPALQEKKVKGTIALIADTLSKEPEKMKEALAYYSKAKVCADIDQSDSKHSHHSGQVRNNVNLLKFMKGETDHLDLIPRKAHKICDQKNKILDVRSDSSNISYITNLTQLKSIKEWNIKQLREMCGNCSLHKNGNKKPLYERLYHHLETFHKFKKN